MAHVLERGDEPASVLEIISPAGLEQLFRILGSPAGPPDEEAFAQLEATYRCDVDMERT